MAKAHGTGAVSTKYHQGAVANSLYKGTVLNVVRTRLYTETCFAKNSQSKDPYACRRQMQPDMHSPEKRLF